MHCSLVTVVLLVDNHLWRQIVQGSTECVTSRRRSMNRPTEICNLQCILQANQDVFRLDVSMDDVLRVAVFDGLAGSPMLFYLQGKRPKN